MSPPVPSIAQDRLVNELEADLWKAADNLRANSKLTSSDSNPRKEPPSAGGLLSATHLIRAGRAALFVDEAKLLDECGRGACGEAQAKDTDTGAWKASSALLGRGHIAESVWVVELTRIERARGPGVKRGQFAWRDPEARRLDEGSELGPLDVHPRPHQSGAMYAKQSETVRPGGPTHGSPFHSVT